MRDLGLRDGRKNSNIILPQHRFSFTSQFKLRRTSRGRGVKTAARKGSDAENKMFSDGRCSVSVSAWCLIYIYNTLTYSYIALVLKITEAILQVPNINLLSNTYMYQNSSGIKIALENQNSIKRHYINFINNSSRLVRVLQFIFTSNTVFWATRNLFCLQSHVSWTCAKWDNKFCTTLKWAVQF